MVCHPQMGFIHLRISFWAGHSEWEYPLPPVSCSTNGWGCFEDAGVILWTWSCINNLTLLLDISLTHLQWKNWRTEILLHHLADNLSTQNSHLLYNPTLLLPTLQPTIQPILQPTLRSRTLLNICPRKVKPRVQVPWWSRPMHSWLARRKIQKIKVEAANIFIYTMWS